MRVGFDALRALRNPTGLGNYSRRVLHALHDASPPIDIYLFSSRPPRAAYADLPASLNARLIQPRRWGALAPSVWRTFRAGCCAASYGVDVYHGLSHEIPRDLPGTRVRSVVTFHDLLFETAPQLFPAVDRWSYRWRYRWSARHADAIVAVSSATRDALMAHYRIDPSRIAVIPPPRDEAFAEDVPATRRQAVRARFGLPDEYLLSVGTLEPRKNHQLVVSALAQPDGRALPPIVLVGRDGGAEAAIRRAAARAGVADRVHIVQDVPSSDLPAIVRGARLFLYPSTAEGFGMPIVEALTAGVPVLAASGGHLDDAGGDAARYLPCDRPDVWAREMAALLDDPQAAGAMRQRGLAHADSFRGSQVAARLVALYDALVSVSPLPG